MQITVLGLNHKTAPVDIRERFSVSPEKIAPILGRFESGGIFDERLFLSTCNRTEIYGVSRNNSQQSIQLAKSALGEIAHLPIEAFEDKLYILRQPDSIQHLFSVASGLDSMVIGETEITGQVKDAYLEAHRVKQTGKVLNTLFQRSLKVAKNLRTRTEIGTRRVSVASVAVELAEKIYEKLEGKNVLVLGTGEMAEQVTRAMTGRGAVPAIVSDRHLDRAEDLVQRFGGEALHYDLLEKRIATIDILIASTRCPIPVITQTQVRHWMKIRHNRPLFLIDIALPRNIEGTVNAEENVYLYNLDDLQGIAGANLAFRQSQAEECRAIVDEQTQRFMGWLTKECGFPSERNSRV